MPAQGTVADSIKNTMIRVHPRLLPTAGIVANFHDELVVETPERNAENIATLLSTAMRTSLESAIPGVPVKVETRITKSLDPTSTL